MPEALGNFLKSKRNRLRPCEADLTEGTRRRVPGLRRAELAELAAVSVHYYIELEQGRAHSPSASVLAALSRALRLSAEETDHLYLLADQQPPAVGESLHISECLLELYDRLADSPAMICTDLYGPLLQNSSWTEHFGRRRRREGAKSSFVYLWFTDVSVREVFPRERHELYSWSFITDLRRALIRRGKDEDSTGLLIELRRGSPEFVGIWNSSDVPPRMRTALPKPGEEDGVEVGISVVRSTDCAQQLCWLAPW